MKKARLLSAFALLAVIGVCMSSVGGADAPVSRADAELRSQFEVLKRDMSDRAWYEKIASQTYNSESLIGKADRDPTDVVIRRTGALLKDLQKANGAANLAAEAKQLAALTQQCKSVEVSSADARYKLYTEVCSLRRKIALSNPLLKDLKEILFIKRRPSANHICDQYFGFNQRPGGGLFIMSDPFGAKPALRNVLEKSVVQRGRLKGKKLDSGAFLSPDLSFDAKTIAFAYTQCGRGDKWSPERSLHIFKVNSDGTGLEQLSDGSWNEFDPCWLPNGRIIFISERRGGFGRCHPRPVPTYTLFSMLPDGRDIVPISYHETNEWQPSVDHNGMVIYTRWDYVDRGDCIAHHPWITTPDGRDARAIQGNYAKHRNARPDAEADFRAIPGSQKLMATGTPHHGQSYGSIIIVDPNVEDDGAMAAVKRVTPETRFPECDRGGTQSYAAPWPLSEKYFLCVYSGQGLKRRMKEKYGLYLVDAFGNKELIYRDPQISCLSPIPFRPRTKPPVLPHMTDIGFPPGHPKAGSTAHKPQATGTVVCTNVYNGLLPWPKDTKIKSLRVVQLFPKATIRIGQPRIGAASESLARGVIGTAPVETDGSVHFTAPAGKPFYFQALDAKGRAVQSMMSLTYVHPGESLVCQGCHERRHDAPKVVTSRPLALKRAPSKLKGDVSGSFPLAYPRLVQPVLDRKCIKCHEKKRKEKKKTPDLSTSLGSFKILSRMNKSFSGKPPGRLPTRTVPGQFGTSVSKLYQMLAKGHNDVKLTDEEMHRIILWIDCNSNFYGAYLKTKEQEKGELVMPSIE